MPLHDDYSRSYTMSKEEAAGMLLQITGDKDGPYWNDSVPVAERERVLALVMRLREIVAGQRTGLEGYLNDLNTEKEGRIKGVYENPDPYGENRSSKYFPKRNDPNDGEQSIVRERFEADRANYLRDKGSSSLGKGSAGLIDDSGDDAVRFTGR